MRDDRRLNGEVRITNNPMFLIEPEHDAPNPFQPHPHAPIPLAGKTVLVNGAGGGVGHLAVQIALWQGARVIAVALGRNEALIRALEVDQFIDYRMTAADGSVRDVDPVLDTVGGKEASHFLKTLKRGGALFLVFPIGFDAQAEAGRLGVTISSTQVRSSGAQLAQAAPLLEAGTVRVVIDSTFSLAEAASAHARVERGGIQGKIVLTAA